MKLRMLDLFCGHGLAAWGYWYSGRFREIVGVDNDASLRDRYSFDFVHADALGLDYEFLAQFDFVHASPPCQAYSKQTPGTHRSKHPRLIRPTHAMLTAWGGDYVIENVEGSGGELRPNLCVNGFAFGLTANRRRYFHLSWLKEPLHIIGKGAPATQINKSAPRLVLMQAMGLKPYVPDHALQKMTNRGINQGIPPVFTYGISTLHNLHLTEVKP